MKDDKVDWKALVTLGAILLAAWTVVSIIVDSLHEEF